MGVIQNIRKKINSKIWYKYRFWIVLGLVVAIGIMNVTIYKYVKSYTDANLDNTAMDIVRIQARNLGQLFDSYKEDAQFLTWNFSDDNIPAILKEAEDLRASDPSKYGSFRITLLNGDSYTLIDGLDSINHKDTDVYENIVNKGEKVVISSPYSGTSKVKGSEFKISTPIVKNGALRGYVTMGIPKSIIDDPVSKLKINGTGFGGFAFSRKYCLAYFNQDSIIQFVMEKKEIERRRLRGLPELLSDSYDEYEKGLLTENFGFYSAGRGSIDLHFKTWFVFVPGTDIATLITVPIPFLYLPLYKLLLILFVASAVMVLIIYKVFKKITFRHIITPIEQINKFVVDLTHGKLDSSAINEIKNNNEVSKMKASFLLMRDKISGAVTEIRKSADEMIASSETFVTSAKQINDDSKVEQDSIQDISLTLNNISQGIDETNRKAQKTKDSSLSISDEIGLISKYSAETLDTIKTVINKVDVINKITQRTDLLAVNATIEAARAGDNGKGFAVVAAEIRNLAEICQKASNDINMISAESLKVTEESTQLISNITPKIQESTSKVSEISAECSEQLTIVNSIACTVDQLVRISNSNAASSEHLLENASLLRKSCDGLKENVGFFKYRSTQNSGNSDIIDAIEEQLKRLDMLRSKLSK